MDTSIALFKNHIRNITNAASPEPRSRNAIIKKQKTNLAQDGLEESPSRDIDSRPIPRSTRKINVDAVEEKKSGEPTPQSGIKRTMTQDTSKRASRIVQVEATERTSRTIVTDKEFRTMFVGRSQSFVSGDQVGVPLVSESRKILRDKSGFIQEQESSSIPPKRVHGSTPSSPELFGKSYRLLEVPKTGQRNQISYNIDRHTEENALVKMENKHLRQGHRQQTNVKAKAELFAKSKQQPRPQQEPIGHLELQPTKSSQQHNSRQQNLSDHAIMEDLLPPARAVAETTTEQIQQSENASTKKAKPSLPRHYNAVDRATWLSKGKSNSQIMPKSNGTEKSSPDRSDKSAIQKDRMDKDNTKRNEIDPRLTALPYFVPRVSRSSQVQAMMASGPIPRDLGFWAGKGPLSYPPHAELINTSAVPISLSLSGDIVFPGFPSHTLFGTLALPRLNASAVSATISSHDVSTVLNSKMLTDSVLDLLIAFIRMRFYRPDLLKCVEPTSVFVKLSNERKDQISWNEICDDISQRLVHAQGIDKMNIFLTALFANYSACSKNVESNFSNAQETLFQDFSGESWFQPALNSKGRIITSNLVSDALDVPTRPYLFQRISNSLATKVPFKYAQDMLLSYIDLIDLDIEVDYPIYAAMFPNSLRRWENRRKLTSNGDVNSLPKTDLRHFPTRNFVTLNRSHMNASRPDNSYGELMKPKIHVVSSLFSTQIEGCSKPEDYHRLVRWLNRAGVNIIDLDYLVIPICIENHWTVAIVAFAREALFSDTTDPNHPSAFDFMFNPQDQPHAKGKETLEKQLLLSLKRRAEDRISRKLETRAISSRRFQAESLACYAADHYCTPHLLFPRESSEDEEKANTSNKFEAKNIQLRKSAASHALKNQYFPARFMGNRLIFLVQLMRLLDDNDKSFSGKSNLLSIEQKMTYVENVAPIISQGIAKKAFELLDRGKSNRIGARSPKGILPPRVPNELPRACILHFNSFKQQKVSNTFFARLRVFLSFAMHDALKTKLNLNENSPSKSMPSRENGVKNSALNSGEPGNNKVTGAKVKLSPTQRSARKSANAVNPGLVKNSVATSTRPTAHSNREISEDQASETISSDCDFDIIHVEVTSEQRGNSSLNANPNVMNVRQMKIPSEHNVNPTHPIMGGKLVSNDMSLISTEKKVDQIDETLVGMFLDSSQSIQSITFPNESRIQTLAKTQKLEACLNAIEPLPSPAFYSSMARNIERRKLSLWENKVIEFESEQSLMKVSEAKTARFGKNGRGKPKGASRHSTIEADSHDASSANEFLDEFSLKRDSKLPNQGAKFASSLSNQSPLDIMHRLRKFNKWIPKQTGVAEQPRPLTSLVAHALCHLQDGFDEEMCSFTKEVFIEEIGKQTELDKDGYEALSNIITSEMKKSITSGLNSLSTSRRIANLFLRSMAVGLSLESAETMFKQSCTDTHSEKQVDKFVSCKVAEADESVVEQNQEEEDKEGVIYERQENDLDFADHDTKYIFTEHNLPNFEIPTAHQQRNEFDCGLHIVQIVESLFDFPIVFERIVRLATKIPGYWSGKVNMRRKQDDKTQANSIDEMHDGETTAENLVAQLPELYSRDTPSSAENVESIKLSMMTEEDQKDCESEIASLSLFQWPRRSARLQSSSELIVSSPRARKTKRAMSKPEIKEEKKESLSLKTNNEEVYKLVPTLVDCTNSLDIEIENKIVTIKIVGSKPKTAVETILTSLQNVADLKVKEQMSSVEQLVKQLGFTHSEWQLSLSQISAMGMAAIASASTLLRSVLKVHMLRDNDDKQSVDWPVAVFLCGILEGLCESAAFSAASSRSLTCTFFSKIVKMNTGNVLRLAVRKALKEVFQTTLFEHFGTGLSNSQSETPVYLNPIFSYETLPQCPNDSSLNSQGNVCFSHWFWNSMLGSLDIDRASKLMREEGLLEWPLHYNGDSLHHNNGNQFVNGADSEVNVGPYTEILNNELDEPAFEFFHERLNALLHDNELTIRLRNDCLVLLTQLILASWRWPSSTEYRVLLGNDADTRSDESQSKDNPLVWKNSSIIKHLSEFLQTNGMHENMTNCPEIDSLLSELSKLDLQKKKAISGSPDRLILPNLPPRIRKNCIVVALDGNPLSTMYDAETIDHIRISTFDLIFKVAFTSGLLDISHLKELLSLLEKAVADNKLSDTLPRRNGRNPNTPTSAPHWLVGGVLSMVNRKEFMELSEDRKLSLVAFVYFQEIQWSSQTGFTDSVAQVETNDSVNDFASTLDSIIGKSYDLSTFDSGKDKVSREIQKKRCEAEMTEETRGFLSNELQTKWSHKTIKEFDPLHIYE